MTMHPLYGKIVSRRYGENLYKKVLEEIRYRAETGKYIVRGFGYSGKLPDFDDLLLVPVHGLGTRAPVDQYREKVDTTVVIGKGMVKRPLVLKTPVMIGAMSYGATSREFKLACAKAANEVGTASNTGEGGMVTEEIAYTRGIPKGTDCLSPARHLDIRSIDDLKKVIKIIRDIVGYEKPVGIKLGPGNAYKEAYAAAQCDIDFLAIDGKYGGTGASPQHAIQGLGLPTIAIIPQADKALRDAGVRDQVTLIALGGFRDGADVAKALALGADAVALVSAIEIAAGCIMCGMCATGRCPVGICTQDPELRKKIGGGKGLEQAAKWIANYMHAVTKEVAQLAAACGHKSVREFEPEDLRAITLEAAAIAGVKLAGIDDYVLPQWKEIRGK